MNENIDLTKILKNCPKGTKLYSTVLGNVSLKDVIDNAIYPIIVKCEDGLIETFTNDGKMEKAYYGECTIFPSKEQRDWSKFTAPWYKKERFNPKSLNPFDKVIYRNNVDHQWIAGFFSHVFGEEYYDVYICGSGVCVYCIPYNDDTKHLVGTTEEAPNFYKYWED